MQLLFLSERTLQVIDYATATDDYEIVLDALVPQKSTFVVNKESLRAEVGDYLVVREPAYFYIGVIKAVEAANEVSLKVTTLDFLTKFDVSVPVSSFSGNIAQFLINLINTHFRISSDPKQNMDYLQTIFMVIKPGVLTYENNKFANILTLVEEFAKTYGIRLAYELVITEGVISNILVKVVEVETGLTLKSNLGTIANLVVANTDNTALNKITFLPKVENVTHKTAVSYYLLTDGSVSTNSSAPNRLERVNFKYELFSDDEYSSLLTKATSALIDSSLQHHISFDFTYSQNQIRSLDHLKIGTFVRFITPTKTYHTVVTKVTFKGTFNMASIVLGEHRTMLTDKLKLLDKRRS